MDISELSRYNLVIRIETIEINKSDNRIEVAWNSFGGKVIIVSESEDKELFSIIPYTPRELNDRRKGLYPIWNGSRKISTSLIRSLRLQDVTLKLKIHRTPFHLESLRFLKNKLSNNRALIVRYGMISYFLGYIGKIYINHDNYILKRKFRNNGTFTSTIKRYHHEDNYFKKNWNLFPSINSSPEVSRLNKLFELLPYNTIIEVS